MNRYLLLSLFSTITVTASAQVSQTLDLSAEAAAGNGAYTAFFLTANRHGILSSRTNTSYLRAAYHAEKECGDWRLSGTADMQLSVRPSEHTPLYLQQLYLQAQWQWLDLRIGSREIAPLFRDQSLSSGSTVWSGNARPIPGAYIGTHQFVNIPGTRQWIQFYMDASYGYYLDSDYLEDEYDKYLIGKTGYGRSYCTTQVWSHQKRAALRTRPDKPLVFTFSCDHAVQFGGKSVNYIDPTLCGDFSPAFKDLFTVILPLHGDDTSTSGDQAFVYGNHIGNLSAMLEYQWEKDFSRRVALYCEDPFEDGSGIRKGNRMDGLWGIEYQNKADNALIQGIVLEYLQTTDQSGPIHWAPGDFAGQAISNVAHSAQGADNYYNNFFYNGYSHFGQACGSPLLKSPAYNADHYLCFTDNRVLAWHLGLRGHLWTFPDPKRGELSYRLLASHRRSWGTYFEPAPSIRLSTSAMAEFTYAVGRWQSTVAYAFDEGDLMGHNHTINVRINYHLPF